MKTKKVSKKLNLGKVTVTLLNSPQMNNINGGKGNTSVDYGCICPPDVTVTQCITCFTYCITCIDECKGE